MPKSRVKNAVPPVKRACPTDDEGNELCSFHYEGVNARETEGDWLAQFCKNCKHLMFIDKRNLANGKSS